ncbi:MAG: hypothetical protein C0498_13750 [Anaerolinea sp.]|jgi:hypothetical protein|nr:hypothetical protein [Anaerolinea sp.]
MIAAIGEPTDDERPDTAAGTGEIEVQPVRQPRPEMGAEQMRHYLTEVGAHLAAGGMTGEIVLAGGPSWSWR